MDNVRDIETEKSHALKVITSFLAKLEASTDSLSIELNTYAIKCAADESFQRMHRMNAVEAERK